MSLSPYRLGVAMLLMGVVAAGCAAAEAGSRDGAGAVPSTLPPVTALPTAPGSTSSSPPATTTTARPPRHPAVLGFAGDVSFTHGLHARDPLGDVSDLLAAPDLTAVNLETTVAEPDVGTALDKTYVFKSPPESVGILAESGIDVVSLANNHTLDYRREGLIRTVELLTAGSVTGFGAGPDSRAAYSPVVVDVGDWRVAYVGLTRVECGWVADDPTRWPEAAWACPGFEERTVEAVRDASEIADVTVVMVHWGIELDHCPQPYQRDLAGAWVAAGADLVIGGHPHVLQGIERIDGSWVVHSTGNFAFPSARGPSARSAFFTATLDEDGISIHVTPVSIVDGRPVQMTGAARSELLGELSRWSFGWVVDDDGSLMEAGSPGVCGAS